MCERDKRRGRVGAGFHMVEITQAHAAVLAHMHGEAFAVGWDAGAFLSALQQPGAFGFIVAQNDGDEPLGFALLRAVFFADGTEGGGEAEVLTIATRPLARHQGVARLAMDAALKHACERGTERVFLEVSEDNAAARALYESLGFCEVGRRKAYYARGQDARVDAIVMALDLRLNPRS